MKSRITKKTSQISKRFLSGVLTAVLAFSPATPLLVTARAAAAETDILFPTGQGAYTAWENGVATVDETGTPSCNSGDSIKAGYSEGDDDSDDGDRESVNISLLSIPNNSVITSVTVHVTYQAHESGYTGGTFKTFVRLNGTNVDAATNITANNTDCTTASQTLDVTDTKKNDSTSLEIGVIKTGADSPERNKVRVGTLRAVVTYTDGEQKNQIDDWCAANGVKFDPPVDGAKEGITADFSPNTNEPQTVTITTDGTKVITKVVVKGGSSGGNGGAGNQVYESGPFTDLVAPLNTNSAPADDTYAISHVIVCYDENLPTETKLFLKKVVINDNGGQLPASAFELSASGPQGFSGTPQIIETTATTSVGILGGKVSPGTFTLSEQNLPGYQQDNWTCDSGKTVANNQVTVNEGETVTCTITNDDIAPKLTVIKTVINNNGGDKVAGDFTIQVNGANVSIPSFPGSENGTTVTLDAGEYSVSETGPAGYTATFSGDCDNNINIGEHKQCTITNDDNKPTLTLEKQLYTGTWGGNATPADWLLKAILSGDTDPSVSGYGYAESDDAFQAGTYILSEHGPFGYKASEWRCNGQAVVDGVISIGIGQTLNCVILNSSKPAKITVEKKVINDDGGTAKARDFDLWVGNEKVRSDKQENFRGDTWYRIFEAGGPEGYKQVSKECWDITFGWNNKEKQSMPYGKLYAKVGHKYYCKIVNDDIAPKLTIKKDATPNSIQPFTFTLEKKTWNGWITKNTFQLNDNNTPYPLDNDETFTLKAGTYRVTESETDGWYLKGITCRGVRGERIDLKQGRVTLNLKVGDKVTCEFENNKYAKITGFKFEDANKDGKWNFGEKGLEGWEITLDKKGDHKPAVSTFTDEHGAFSFDNLKPGKYVVCEIQQDGWVQTAPASGCKELWLKTGDREFVKFGNFQYGAIRGIKFNDVNGNGAYDQGDLTLSGWMIQLKQGGTVTTTFTDENGAYSFDGLDLGTYTICEVQQPKWAQTYPAKDGKEACHEVAITASGQVFEGKDFGNKPLPQVLGEEDPGDPGDPATLTKTGASAAISTGFGLIVLSVLGALHFLTRKHYEN